jgi:hypothetical protein
MRCMQTATRNARSGRGGYGRSPYNERGERLDRILTRQGRRLKWLLDRLDESERPVSRQTLYRARLPESDPLYINVDNDLWVEVAKILQVHPSELLGSHNRMTARPIEMSKAS